MWLFTGPPRFRKASRINLAFSLGMAVSSVGILTYFRARNVRKQREAQRLLQMHGDGTGISNVISHASESVGRGETKTWRTRYTTCSFVISSCSGNDRGYMTTRTFNQQHASVKKQGPTLDSLTTLDRT